MTKKFSFIIFLILSFIAAGAVVFAVIFQDLPKPEEFENRKINQSTKIYDRTGEVLLYEIHGEEKRTVIPFEEIPDYVKKATLIVEDQNFYNHPAFDWKGIIRAIITNFLKGEVVQGGSTITQQLAKNAFLSKEKTLIRKIKELVVAFELEKKYSKDEILNLYLNQIPYGGNAYGIEAAAQTFFRKNTKDLNIAEAVLLASLPKAPTYYSPWGSHLNELLARKDYFLEQMQKSGYLNEKERIQAQKIKLEFAPKATGIKAPHFVLTVQDYLNKKYGEDFVESAGLNVITTLDWNLQQLAEKAVSEGAERNKNLYKGHNAALVAQHATSGQIIALVGSKDYFADPEPKNCTPGKNCHFEGNFNVAVQGLRQPGSAMKPLAYITAFSKGYSPETIVFDVPTEFAANNPKCPAVVDFDNKAKECFHPHNFDEKFRGPVSLRNSLAQSINIPSVKTLYLAGIDNTLKTAKDFGITTLTERSRYGLSLVLGGGEVTLTELVGAYSVFAQEGVKHPQTMILKVTDSKGKILEEYQNHSSQVIEPQFARLINDVLSDVKARSPLFQNSLSLTVFPGHEVALKTGTTNDYRDAWAIGYTPDLVVGVWAGNNDNVAMEKQGSSILAAVPIWSAFMKEALKNRPLITFNKPDPIFSKKSILRGESIVKYKIGEKIYPQIHNILYYVDKNNPQGDWPINPENDPQFLNWETAVLNWAKNNIPNFITYNYPLPGGMQENSESDYSQPVISFLSPQNGDFIKNQINAQVQIASSMEIKNIELFFNNQLVDKQTSSFGASALYQFNFLPKNIEIQNSLKIRITDSVGNQNEKEIILFK
jgi:1A family penicillin-binding protein